MQRFRNIGTRRIAALIGASIIALTPTGLVQAGVAQAGVAPQEAPGEAQQLGTTLTLFGAESAGDKEGIIPPYKGGLQTPPPNYKPGSNIRPDPFHWEKPLFAIDSRSMAQFDAVLTEGTKALMTAQPDFRIDVYPTHRSAAYPQAFLDNTVKNAQRCATADAGLALTGPGCSGGLPFPMPKTGNEAMWNHLLAWRGRALAGRQHDWLVDRRGPVLLALRDVYQGAPWYGAGFKPDQPYRQTETTIEGPPRIAGARTLVLDFLDPVLHPSMTWQYLQGERGVRLAADATHDLAAEDGGVGFYDDVDLFSGALDRFDFRLVGKKEMIIPYNNYKQQYRCQPEEDLQPGFINPDCMRWELHRVWVVEATLKPHRTHAYGRRLFYWDEDTWSGGASDEYDNDGRLQRAGFAHIDTWYESQINSAQQYVIYDLRKHSYELYGESAGRADSLHVVDPLPPLQLTPDMMAGTSVQ